MHISTSDCNCRYVAAPGTRADPGSAFGRLLAESGIIFPIALSLETLVAQRLITPRLRVALPQEAFHAWRNYPLHPMELDETKVRPHEWALQLYTYATCSARQRSKEKWWVHFLDDKSSDLRSSALANALDPSEDCEQTCFTHRRHARPLKPWIDYFGYWQVYEIADLLSIMSANVAASEAGVESLQSWIHNTQYVTAARLQRRRVEWNTRSTTFAWLSLMRTAAGYWASGALEWSLLQHACRAICLEAAVTTEQMARDIKRTLLVMWRDMNLGRPQQPAWTPLHSMLRQDIELAIKFLELCTGDRVDFLDPQWFDDRANNEWASLIDALPKEIELARRWFPDHASIYIHSVSSSIPPLMACSVGTLRALIDTHWAANRPLRRLALALHRLQEELRGEQVSDRAIIRSVERIEQLNSLLLHTERVLVFQQRQRKGLTTRTDLRGVAKYTLDYLLTQWSIVPKIRVTALARMKELLNKHAFLHDLPTQQHLPLIKSADVGSGHAASDDAVAAFVNLIIARNYAAHHDVLDESLVYPSHTDPHSGAESIRCALVSVVACLGTPDADCQLRIRPHLIGDVSALH